MNMRWPLKGGSGAACFLHRPLLALPLILPLTPFICFLTFSILTPLPSMLLLCPFLSFFLTSITFPFLPLFFPSLYMVSLDRGSLGMILQSPLSSSPSHSLSFSPRSSPPSFSSIPFSTLLLSSFSSSLYSPRTISSSSISTFQTNFLLGHGCVSMLFM